MEAKEPGSPAEIYSRAVDRLISAGIGDRRVRALWLEGASRKELRPPYKKLEIHLAADEPDFDGLLRDLEGFVAGPAKLHVESWSDVPRFARELKGLLEGQPITVILEKTSFLPKRPRNAVCSLIDKTGHLVHVMDFSLARKK